MSDPTSLSGAELDAVTAWWVSGFEFAMSRAEDGAVRSLFHDDAWWRDLLGFTWDLRTAHGLKQLDSAVSERAGQSGLSMAMIGNASFVETGTEPWIQAMFTFTTDLAHGRGVVRLVRRDEVWKAWTVMTAMDGLVGHEELTGANRPHGGAHGSDRSQHNWAESRKQKREFTVSEPAVLIVGAGHGGLGLAARLGCLGIDTLVIDRNPRIGDSWRNRYDSLVLHDPVWYDHLPYLPFPSSWPVYSPKDKLADWLESYAATMELNVWTGTELRASDYDAASGQWSVTLEKADGTTRVVRPSHLVLATGVSGTEPNVPEIAGADTYSGMLCHSHGFPHGEDFSGRKAVVVGSCNSGHDIAQELYERGADVTMLQRSPTYVVSVASAAVPMTGLYDESGPPTDVADLLGASFPFTAAPEMHRATTAAMAELDSDMIAALEASGFLVSSGIDGTGAMGLFLHKGGGYYINVGASELIAAGEIKIKAGTEIDTFTESGLELSDGSALAADVVVLATGYRGMLDTARRLLGPDVADRCGPVWGLDDEGELRGVWRQSGHDGLWFMGGNLAMARFYGKFLALQIKAIEEGLVGDASRARPELAVDRPST
ncbi:flavin-containing monooxygenase [Rhodococcoides fascians]|uniref:flavin-containing monooxygenase n=1 Tax=Rhodococcoides fascians TaxID=1828 RepID=UPI001427C991